ncbi:MAG: hypothetical protein IT477_10525 [Rhodanobacteraceae bacterium]|nr:hypothetical protein [Rhodanobacteraceae bacterium]
MALYPFTQRTFEQILSDAGDPLTPSHVLVAMVNEFHHAPYEWRAHLPANALDLIRETVFGNPSTPRAFFLSAFPRMGEETRAVLKNPAFALHVLEGTDFLGCIVEGEARQQTDETDLNLVDNVPRPAALLRDLLAALEAEGMVDEDVEGMRDFFAMAAESESGPAPAPLDVLWLNNSPPPGMWTDHVTWAYDGGDTPRKLSSFLWAIASTIVDEENGLPGALKYRLAARFTAWLHERDPVAFPFTPLYPAILG